MLADSTTTAPLIGGWVIGAVAILQLVTMGMQILRWNQAAKREISPQPLEVRGATEYLPRKVFEAHEHQNQRDMENIFARLGGMDRGIRAEVKQDVAQVHEKVNEVAREVSEHTATLEIQNQQMAAMNSKLDRLVERRPQ